MLSGYEFALGLVLGFIFSVYAIRYFDKHYPAPRTPTSSGSAPFYKRPKEKKKPVVKDEFQEYQAEIERLKEQGR